METGNTAGTIPVGEALGSIGADILGAVATAGAVDMDGTAGAVGTAVVPFIDTAARTAALAAVEAANVT